MTTESWSDCLLLLNRKFVGERRCCEILKPVVLATLCALVFVGCAGVQVKSGSVQPLKTANSLNLRYDYEGMQIFEFPNGEDFVCKQVTKLNAEEPGKGDLWKAGWVANRNALYQPRFEETFSRALANRHVGIALGHDSEAKYTLCIKTTYTKVWHKLANIRVDAILYETKDPAAPLAVLSVDETYHDAWGNTHSDGYRLQTTYGMAGKHLGQHFADNLK